MKTCTLVFLRRKDEVLLAMKKRGFGIGRWNGVGGKVEPDETLEQATTRECREEIDITPLHFRKVAIHDFIMNAGANPWHMHVHVFIVDKWQGEPQESEEMAPKWFKISDIPYEDMWQDDIFWLPAVLKGKTLTTTIDFDENDNMLTATMQLVDSLS